MTYNAEYVTRDDFVYFGNNAKYYVRTPNPGWVKASRERMCAAELQQELYSLLGDPMVEIDHEAVDRVAGELAAKQLTEEYNSVKKPAVKESEREDIKILVFSIIGLLLYPALVILHVF